MKAQIQKWGNSLALRIPRSFASESNIEQGSVVDLTVVEGKLIVEPVSRNKYTLEQLLEGVSRKNIHREIDTGDPVGKEIW
ncbi:MAG: AbrB/MazE/SpoVT family DNA-binding domain-containing protein [Acidobacteriota bacterium]